MVKNIAGLFLLGILSLNCEQDQLPEESELEIRIENVSNYDFENVIINTDGGERRYALIGSGELTDYENYDFAYSYAFVELAIDEDTFRIQPIDYVGEEKLASGNYTYQINADESTSYYGRLTIELVQD